MDANVNVLQDVQIEHAEENAITVLSEVPGIRGEQLTVRFGLSDAEPMTLDVCTTGSEPRLLDGRLVHRVHLSRTGAPAATTGVIGRTPSLRSTDPATVMFVRRHAARIVNISRGGCLVELSSRVPVGTVATLQRDDTTGPEPVRINSLQERKGGSWPYAVGAEFLSFEPASSQSLRALACRMEAEEGLAADKSRIRSRG